MVVHRGGLLALLHTLPIAAAAADHDQSAFPESPLLGFLELQAGPRGAPRRIVFASTPLGEMNSALFDLLRGRHLLGACMDRTVLGPGALQTRGWQRNASTAALPARQPLPELWEQQQTLAAARESLDASLAAQSVLLTLQGGRPFGISLVLQGLATDVDQPRADGVVVVGLGSVVQGQHVLAEMYDAAQRKRPRNVCGVHVVESGILLLPEDPEDPSDEKPPLSLLPTLDTDGNNERISLPLGRPVASLHRHQQLSSAEPRDVYHYQVETDGVPLGHQLLLGALSHDSGQPTLLLSYAARNPQPSALPAQRPARPLLDGAHGPAQVRVCHRRL